MNNVNKYISDITDAGWQIVTLNNLKYCVFKAKINGKALIRQIKEDKTAGKYINYKNYKYYLKKPKRAESEYYCCRCGHDKRSIYHKVFSTCARHKRKTYNQGKLFNNYLASMPDKVNYNSEYYDNVWCDNYDFAKKTGNDILLETLENIVEV